MWDIRLYHLRLRKDKYQKKLILFWVDVKTTGLREIEKSEAIRDTTFGEGSAPDDIHFGGFDAAPMTSLMDLEHSEASEDEGSEEKSSRHSKKSKADDLCQEHALEARCLLLSAALSVGPTSAAVHTCRQRRILGKSFRML